MKLLICALAVMALGMVAACDERTPAYTSSERFGMIQRNIQFDEEAFNDDVDTALMLRPKDSLTIWNVYQRN